MQKRAARYVTNNHILEEGNTAKNMASLNWVTLEERRARSKLFLLFKGRTGEVDIPTEDLLVSSRSNRNSAQSNFHIPYSSVNSHLYSFYPSTIRLWNSLPQDIKSSPNLDQFKNSISKITIKQSYQTPTQCHLI